MSIETDWLKQIFQYENCEECGGDEKDHEAVRGPFGKLFARCLRKSTDHNDPRLSSMSNPFQVSRNKPFQHNARHGVELISNRCDLMGDKVDVECPTDITPQHLAEAIAEIIAYWAVHIYPEIVKDGQGFSGFDCIKFNIKYVG